MSSIQLVGTLHVSGTDFFGNISLLRYDSTSPGFIRRVPLWTRGQDAFLVMWRSRVQYPPVTQLTHVKCFGNLYTGTVLFNCSVPFSCQETHGYVGADLSALVGVAAMSASEVN